MKYYVGVGCILLRGFVQGSYLQGQLFLLHDHHHDDHHHYYRHCVRHHEHHHCGWLSGEVGVPRVHERAFDRGDRAPPAERQTPIYGRMAGSRGNSSQKNMQRILLVYL